MLWLCEMMIGKPGWPTHKQIVLAVCSCAELTLKYMSGKTNARNCIKTIRAWIAGTVSIEEVREARRDAFNAIDSSAAALAAAAYAIEGAEGPGLACAAYVASIAASTIGGDSAADSDAKTKTLNQCAKISRRSFKVPGVRLEPKRG
jgi:hypothetical protein